MELSGEEKTGRIYARNCCAGEMCLPTTDAMLRVRSGNHPEYFFRSLPSVIAFLRYGNRASLSSLSLLDVNFSNHIN